MKFWHDVWCGDNPLSMCFLDLFRIGNDKEAYVADLMQFPKGVLLWDLEFLLEIHDRESDFVCFLGCYIWSLVKRYW